MLFGEEGNDTLIGREGLDLFVGGEDIDTFYFDAYDELIDGIFDYATGIGGDVLDLSAVLSFRDGIDDIAEFFQLTENTAIGGTDIVINADGDGTGFTTIANSNVSINEPLVALLSNGDLVLDVNTSVAALVETSAVPEPTSLGLLLIASLAAANRRGSSQRDWLRLP